MRSFASISTCLLPVHHTQEPATASLVMSMFDLSNDFQHDPPADSDAGALPAGDQPPSPPVGRHSGGYPSRVLSLGSLLESARKDLFSGKRPVEYAVASEPWGSIALRPGEVIA